MAEGEGIAACMVTQDAPSNHSLRPFGRLSANAAIGQTLFIGSVPGFQIDLIITLTPEPADTITDTTLFAGFDGSAIAQIDLPCALNANSSYSP